MIVWSLTHGACLGLTRYLDPVSQMFFKLLKGLVLKAGGILKLFIIPINRVSDMLPFTIESG